MIAFARWSFLAALLLAPTTADAFCGFYVSGADSGMFNNATQVVLMREGTRTVLSMQNNYQGPPTDFAMVVPVPVVLSEDNVKTLPRDVFAKVDAMGAPRLVEYWEMDPCMVEPPYAMGGCPMCGAGGGAIRLESGAMDDKDYGVKVEAEFTVGEYQIQILSAKEATGLDRWLRDQHYKIPTGAAPLLRPYVESGMKFFVAKVDPTKVTFENGMATLSPLRFHYDSEEFALPVRLGLANSPGTQDLIVNILASQRYEVANYGNVTIPTNLDVKEEARARFGEFYAALFDRTLEKNQGAVVTEYAWDAMTCDPCPGPNLDYHDFATLGADVLEGGSGTYVLTRLHARYSKDDLQEDLVFKGASPIVGGREQMAADGKLEERARPDSYNNFQGRYAIRHEWTGEIKCEHPIRGRWGGPPGGMDIADGAGETKSATNTAFAPRGQLELPMVVAEDVPEIDVKAGVPLPRPTAANRGPRGCACNGSGADVGLAIGLLVLVFVRRRKK
jgi:hypothetical protein